MLSRILPIGEINSSHEHLLSSLEFLLADYKTRFGAPSYHLRKDFDYLFNQLTLRYEAVKDNPWERTYIASMRLLLMRLMKHPDSRLIIEGYMDNVSRRIALFENFGWKDNLRASHHLWLVEKKFLADTLTANAQNFSHKIVAAKMYIETLVLDTARVYKTVNLDDLFYSLRLRSEIITQFFRLGLAEEILRNKKINDVLYNLLVQMQVALHTTLISFQDSIIKLQRSGKNFPGLDTLDSLTKDSLQEIKAFPNFANFRHLSFNASLFTTTVEQVFAIADAPTHWGFDILKQAIGATIPTTAAEMISAKARQAIAAISNAEPVLTIEGSKAADSDSWYPIMLATGVTLAAIAFLVVFRKIGQRARERKATQLLFMPPPMPYAIPPKPSHTVRPRETRPRSQYVPPGMDLNTAKSGPYIDKDKEKRIQEMKARDFASLKNEVKVALAAIDAHPSAKFYKNWKIGTDARTKIEEALNEAYSATRDKILNNQNLFDDANTARNMHVRSIAPPVSAPAPAVEEVKSERKSSVAAAADAFETSERIVVLRRPPKKSPIPPAPKSTPHFAVVETLSDEEKQERRVNFALAALKEIKKIVDIRHVINQKGCKDKELEDNKHFFALFAAMERVCEALKQYLIHAHMARLTPNLALKTLEDMRNVLHKHQISHLQPTMMDVISCGKTFFEFVISQLQSEPVMTQFSAKQVKILRELVGPTAVDTSVSSLSEIPLLKALSAQRTYHEEDGKMSNSMPSTDILTHAKGILPRLKKVYEELKNAPKGPEPLPFAAYALKKMLSILGHFHDHKALNYLNHLGRTQPEIEKLVNLLEKCREINNNAGHIVTKADTPIAEVLKICELACDIDEKQFDVRAVLFIGLGVATMESRASDAGLFPRMTIAAIAPAAPQSAPAP